MMCVRCARRPFRRMSTFPSIFCSVSFSFCNMSSRSRPEPHAEQIRMCTSAAARFTETERTMYASISSHISDSVFNLFVHGPMCSHAWHRPSVGPHCQEVYSIARMCTCTNTVPRTAPSFRFFSSSCSIVSGSTKESLVLS